MFWNSTTVHCFQWAPSIYMLERMRTIFREWGIGSCCWGFVLYVLCLSVYRMVIFTSIVRFSSGFSNTIFGDNLKCNGIHPDFQWVKKINSILYNYGREKMPMNPPRFNSSNSRKFKDRIDNPFSPQLAKGTRKCWHLKVEGKN